MPSRRGENAKASKGHEKRQIQTKWQERANKSSEEQEKLKIQQKLNPHSPNILNANSLP
jgi:hypothetical protein